MACDQNACEEAERRAPCDHVPDDQGTCVRCGLLLGYTTEQIARPHSRATDEVSIAEAGNLPPDILRSYGAIHMMIDHIKTNNRRLKTFYALYHAYADNLAPQPPEIIARHVRLDKAKIGKACTKFAESKTGYRPRDVRLEPQHYVASYVELLGLSARLVEPLAAVCAELSRGHRDIMNAHPPHKICAAVIFHYCDLVPVPAALCRFGPAGQRPSGARFDKKRFGELVDISTGVLGNLVKRVAPFLPPLRSGGRKERGGAEAGAPKPRA